GGDIIRFGANTSPPARECVRFRPRGADTAGTAGRPAPAATPSAPAPGPAAPAAGGPAAGAGGGKARRGGAGAGAPPPPPAGVGGWGDVATGVTWAGLIKTGGWVIEKLHCQPGVAWQPRPGAARRAALVRQFAKRRFILGTP